LDALLSRRRRGIRRLPYTTGKDASASQQREQSHSRHYSNRHSNRRTPNLWAMSMHASILRTSCGRKHALTRVVCRRPVG